MLLALLMAISLVYSATSIGTCQTLSSAGTTYQLNQSITNNAGTCFTINAVNITLDLMGFTVDGTDAGGARAITTPSAIGH